MATTKMSGRRAIGARGVHAKRRKVLCGQERARARPRAESGGDAGGGGGMRAVVGALPQIPKVFSDAIHFLRESTSRWIDDRRRSSAMQ